MSESAGEGIGFCDFRETLKGISASVEDLLEGSLGWIAGDEADVSEEMAEACGMFGETGGYSPEDAVETL